MRQKSNKYIQSSPYPFDQLDKQIRNQPVKSPSPDKKSANIITPTKSPQLMEIKRNMSPTRFSEKKFERTPIQSKPYEQSTRYYTNEDFQQYRTSQKKNEVFEELENLPQEFILSNSHLQYGNQIHPTPKELDYIKLLQQKQRTIKQLHEIIEMINRNNSLDLSNSQLSGSKNKRFFESSDKSMFSYKQKELLTEKQLKNQVRILTIQNQQLIHMIEKFNEEKKNSNEIQENLKKDKSDYTLHRMRQDLFSREIQNMKESFEQKNQEYEMLLKENKQIYSKYLQLDQENQKLIKMMKEKELSDRKYHASLLESSATQKSNIPETHSKQKLSLVKIKEQYNQSLKVFKDTVYSDVQDFMREIQGNTRALQKKIKQMEEHVENLERFKAAHENIKDEKKQEMKRINTKRSQIEELSEIQMHSPDKQRPKEIEALLIQKSQRIEKELQTQRELNKGITNQMIELRLKYEELQEKYQDILYENNSMNVKLKIQMGDSRKNKIEQIEDINFAKAQEAEIHKLRQLIKNYEDEFENQKQSLCNQINLLSSKVLQYEKVVESERQQFEARQLDAQARIVEKENQMKVNILRFQSQIDHLQNQLSEKESEAVPSQQQALNLQLQSLKNSLIQKEFQLEARYEQISDLKSKQMRMLENQEYTKEEITKLVENYEAQINILKATLFESQLRHQQELQALNSQIRRLISQSQNTEKILLQSQSNHSIQMEEVKGKVKELQEQLNSRHRQSSQLLRSKEVLENDYQSMKEHLQHLERIANDVQQLQDQNKRLQQNLKQSQMILNQNAQIIQNQENQIRSYQDQNKDFQQSISKLQQYVSEKEQRINHLQENLNILEEQLFKKKHQLQEVLNQKNMELGLELQKYQQERAKYEQNIGQLKDQLVNVKQDISLLKQENLLYKDGYNQLLLIKENNLLDQLYQLRSLLSKNLPQPTDSDLLKQNTYDIGKLYIDYQAKICENENLHNNLHELKEQYNKYVEQKHLLEEKVCLLEKNIQLYQSQLKEKKNLTERLINEKNTFQKELLLLKKLKLQSKCQQSDLIKEKVLERLNNIVRLEEKKQSDIRNVVEKRSQSPIKQISPFISKVQEFHTFATKKIGLGNS